jgi:prepilin-type processing-associated H-X9-DG protein
MYAGRVILFNTMLRPNSAVCVNRNNGTAADWQWGVIPPRSRHNGGVQVVFGDGAVAWVSDTIDNGTADSLNGQAGAGPSGVSIAGVWGSLGVRNDGQVTVMQ